MCDDVAVGGPPLEAGGETDRRERHPDTDHVGEHVAGVRQQRERVRRERSDQLHHEEHGDHCEGSDQAAPVSLPRPRQAGAVVVSVIGGHDSHSHAVRMRLATPRGPVSPRRESEP